MEIFKEELVSTKQQIDNYIEKETLRTGRLMTRDALEEEAEEQLQAAFLRDVEESKRIAQEALIQNVKGGDEDETGAKEEFPPGLFLLEYQDVQSVTQTKLFVPPHYTFAELHVDGSRYFQVPASDMTLEDNAGRVWSGASRVAEELSKMEGIAGKLPVVFMRKKDAEMMPSREEEDVGAPKAANYKTFEEAIEEISAEAIKP